MKYREKIHRYVQEHRNSIINTLTELIQTPSVRGKAENHAPFGKGCAQILKDVQTLYETNGFQTELNTDGGYLLSHFGNGTKSFGIFAHADVMPVMDDWFFTSPFTPIEKDGFIIGRGASDDKSAIVISLYCAKILKELNIPFDAKLIMYTGTNEETGMNDIFHYLKNYTPPDFSLVCDSAFPLCIGDKSGIQFFATSKTILKDIVDFGGGIDINIITEKAYAKIGDKFFTETGISKHAALPEGSVNAGYLLSRKLSNMSELSESDRLQMKFVAKLLEKFNGEIFDIVHTDTYFGDLTCSNGIIKTVNGKITLGFDLRYPVGLNADELRKKISQTFANNNWSVRFDDEKPGYIMDKKDKFVKTCLDTFEKFCDVKGPTPSYSAGPTYARELPYAVETGTALYKGVPKGTPIGHGNIHQSDECININGLLDAIELITHMLINCEKVINQREDI